MEISIIISNYNGANFLPKLLDSIFEQQRVALEVIVVDRESTDNSRDILSKYPNISVLTEKAQSGLASGYNRGAREAKNKLLFFCNEDIWLDPSCLSALCEKIDIDQRVATADPWQWGYDGEKRYHAYVRFRSVGWEINSSYPFRKYDCNHSESSSPYSAFPSAGAFMIHREAFFDVGAFDESFFLDDEDVDLGIRLWQRNWRTISVPEAKVYHTIGGSHGKLLTVKSGKTVPVSTRRYISTYSNKSIVGLKYYTGAALVIPALVWLARILNNMIRLRLNLVRMDLQVLSFIATQLPAICRFRKANSSYNKKHPGQEFFLQKEFFVSN